ncbi:MAG: Asp-tRNA(Asn)/Glu-tRNA(Gln) amidotransferase subunit GatB [Candidatus Ratteibacteria bacterium]|jgi:aspartyl-tRNA(Asn)/glutamyl-tRNA(Gln) amidotransferase subunit B
MDYEVVIGLEVHTEMLTASKMFCGCANRFGENPNSQTCPVCLGFPGTLPVINEKAVELALKTALALKCSVNTDNIFARKNYFYPDMPKNYQISQFEEPLAVNGWLTDTIPGSNKKIRILRVHMEEDVGKLIHADGKDYSLVDFNRAGVPLLEIVTQPDIYSPAAAYVFLTNLKAILQYLEISDCNMEEGSLRCDANISLKPYGQKELGTKVEVKNMNSFRSVQRALEYEVERQAFLLDGPDKNNLVQETRLWDETSGKTFPMRSKEEAQDYRYLPEPDLLPLKISDQFIQKVKSDIIELPIEKVERLVRTYQIPAYDAGVLASDKNLADFFESALPHSPDPKLLSNWIMTEILSILKEEKKTIGELNLVPATLGEILVLVWKNTITATSGKEILRLAIQTGRGPKDLVAERGLTQISDTGSLEKMAREALTQNSKSVEDYQSGKKNALGFLVGAVMKQSKGKANPKMVQNILLKLLE